MSINQGFHINVARNYKGETLWPQSKLRYVHFVSIYLGDMLKVDEAKLFLEDTRKRYPAPEFNCTMMQWKLRGEQIE